MIIPGYPESHYFSRPLQAGLGYISEALLKAGISNIIADMRFNYSRRQLLNKIASYAPDLIGVSMMTFKYSHSYFILEEIKRCFPNIPIVAGGPHLSTMREEVLKQCSAIDYGIVLEGEQTIIELCQGKNLEDIKGLIYRCQDGKIAYTGDRQFIKTLDDLPFPTYRQFSLNLYERFIPIISSRGCPYSCIYCPVHLAIGRRYRYRSPENIALEIEFWYRKGFRRFGFADDNFTLLPERVYQLCDEIEKRRLTGLNLSCSNGIRADRVSKDLLKRMKQVGFRELAFGVEAGNDKVLKRLNKSESIATIKKSIGDACDLGYEVTLFFLLGSPGETWSDIQDSISLATSFPVVDVKFYNLIPFPNTELYRWVKANNLLLREATEYLNDASHFVNQPIFQTAELSYRQRRAAWLYANKAVKRHCRQNKARSVQKKIEDSLGIKGHLGAGLAKLWCTDVVQNHLLSLKMVRRFKERLTA